MLVLRINFVRFDNFGGQLRIRNIEGVFFFFSPEGTCLLRAIVRVLNLYNDCWNQELGVMQYLHPLSLFDMYPLVILGLLASIKCIRC